MPRRSRRATNVEDLAGQLEDELEPVFFVHDLARLREAQLANDGERRLVVG